MKFQLAHTRVISLNMETDELEKEEKLFNLGYATQAIPENEKGFRVRFKITLSTEKMKLNVVMDALFNCDDVVKEEFLDSDFAAVNAPAIAFPYVRAYISTLTMQSGFKPVILPTLNFAQMEQEKEMKK